MLRFPFRWVLVSFPTGQEPALEGTEAAQARFTPKAAGDYSVRLTVTDGDLAELERTGWSVMLTSARTGEGVEAAFCALTERMFRPSPAAC